MTDIQFQPLWGDPPKTKGAGGKNHQIDLALEAFVALLRTAPGRWAELSSVDDDGGHPQSRATIIKKRYPECDVQTRAIPNVKGRRRIWVCVRKDIPDVISANGERQREQAREAAARSSG